jgi:hypothetical protein
MVTPCNSPCMCTAIPQRRLHNPLKIVARPPPSHRVEAHQLIVRCLPNHPPVVRLLGEGGQYVQDSNTYRTPPIHPLYLFRRLISHHNMPQTNEEIEATIAEASEAMDRDPYLKGAAAARTYNANYTRLMARRRGRPASNTRGGHNKKLTEP